MARYFFHLKDGVTMLDETGTELPDLKAARIEAVRASGEALTDGANDSLWTGQAWHLWVTDRADGKGTTFFTLHFSASQSETEPAVRQ